MQSVELLPDDRLDSVVREHWRALAAAGLPSALRNRSPSNRPHVTVLAAQAVPDPVAADLPQALSGLPVEAALGGVLLFRRGVTCVLTRLVVPSPTLLDLHRRVLTVAAGCPGLSELSLVGRWTPHVTLARRLASADLPRALAALGPLPKVTGRLVTARRWDGTGRREWLLPSGSGRQDP